jgi:hypothetical protein
MKSLKFLLPLLVVLANGVSAQTYPVKPITMIVPFAPGGGVDTMARLIAPALGQRLGQQIVIDNRGGAGGNIGTEVLARARPDGYTIAMGSLSPNAVNIHLYSRLGFDPIKVYFETGLVPRFPSLIASVGALTISVQLWNTGMILERVNIAHLSQARIAYRFRKN